MTKKQDGAAGRAMFYSAIGAALLFLNYKGFFGAPTIWSYAGAVMLLVLPWFFYRYQWNKNAEEFLPSDAPCSVTDEGIRQEWELEYLVRRARLVAVGRRDHPLPRDPGVGFARISRITCRRRSGDAPRQMEAVVQMVAIGSLLAGSAGDKIWPYTSLFGLTLLWIAALLTLYTGYDYLRAAIRHVITKED
jgi:hypothetical protein